MRWKIPLVVLFFGFYMASLSEAVFSVDVVLNEFSSPSSSDWIEIYNKSAIEYDLSGWLIRDTASSTVYEFSGNKLSAGSFCFVDVSNRLNNAGDKIQLFNGSNEVDCVAYGSGNGSFCDNSADVDAPGEGQTASRIPDGEETWVIGTPTKPTVSCVSLAPTPTPTPTPTATPNSTPTPKPSSGISGGTSTFNSSSNEDLGGDSSGVVVSNIQARGVVAGATVPEEVATFSADLEIEDIKSVSAAAEIIPIATDEGKANGESKSWWLVILGGGLTTSSLVALVLKKYNVNLWFWKNKKG